MITIVSAFNYLRTAFGTLCFQRKTKVICIFYVFHFIFSFLYLQILFVVVLRELTPYNGAHSLQCGNDLKFHLLSNKCNQNESWGLEFHLDYLVNTIRSGSCCDRINYLHYVMYMYQVYVGSQYLDALFPIFFINFNYFLENEIMLWKSVLELYAMIAKYAQLCWKELSWYRIDTT